MVLQSSFRYLENYIKVIHPELLDGQQTDAMFVSIRPRLPIGVNGIGTLLTKISDWRLAVVKKHVTYVYVLEALAGSLWRLEMIALENVVVDGLCAYAFRDKFASQ
jgi:hypothetical protein